MTSLSEEKTGGRRRGGRQARVALRSAPLADDVKPVRPGMLGGTYKPLADDGIARINETALQALEEIGLGQPIPSCVEVCTKAGAILGDDGRLKFPRALVEDTIAMACRDLVLFGRDPKHDMEIGGKRVYYGTAGAATQVIDPIERSYRNATVEDLYNAARIVDVMDNIHFFQRPLTPTDVLDTQRSLFQLQDELASSRGAVVQDLVLIDRAFGGGWDPSMDDRALVDQASEQDVDLNAPDDGGATPSPP
jgi:trimethylamine--corrinoid protein Co-methyltransferase